MISAFSGAAGSPFGRRHAGDDGFEDILDPQAGLGAGQNGVGGIDADHVLDFFAGPIGVRRRQIDLVQHRDDLDPQFDRGVAVGHRLRFDALRRVDD